MGGGARAPQPFEAYARAQGFQPGTEEYAQAVKARRRERQPNAHQRDTTAKAADTPTSPARTRAPIKIIFADMPFTGRKAAVPSRQAARAKISGFQPTNSALSSSSGIAGA